MSLRQKNIPACRLRRILADHRGDVYFEFLICMMLFITIVSLSLQIISAVQLKFWLDNRTAAIVRHVQINGEITADAEAMLTEIKEKLGAGTTVEWDTRFIGESGRVQLGESIRLRITGTVRILQIGAADGLTVPISSESIGTGEVYWK